MKIDIGKSFDKSISIDKLILNDIEVIAQSIKIDIQVYPAGHLIVSP